MAPRKSRPAKQRSEQHLLDEEGQKLFRAALPKEWVVREYRPDYGLDFSIELFKSSEGLRRSGPLFETLGEHIFVQLKSSRALKRSKIKLYGRYNVEKGPEKINKSDYVGEMPVVQFPLETSELITIQRMGAALPVLLVVADLSSGNCHFVCLNDYIDKVLVPRHPDYTDTAQRVIHVPIANRVADPTVGHTAFRWYGKRPKLYAAFQKVVFQHVELNHAQHTPEFLDLARYFARLITSYDFWRETEMWGHIARYGAMVESFLKTGKPGLMVRHNDAIREFIGDRADPDELDRFTKELDESEINELWRCLAVLPRNYEEVCREWFLPTPLGFHTSYPTSPKWAYAANLPVNSDAAR